MPIKTAPAKPAPAKPAPTPKPTPIQLTVNFDILRELQAIAKSRQPGDRLNSLVNASVQAGFSAGFAAGSDSAIQRLMHEAAPAIWRKAFAAGQESSRHVLAIPQALALALQRLAEPPAPAPAPVVIIPAPVVNVEIPARTVKATPQRDGSILMVPQG